MLIGMFDSPFVRRVAVSLQLLGLPFEHANWSVGRDFDRIRRYNPLGRVPTLVCDDGESLLESGAILDYLDQIVGPERALLALAGRERRTALRLMALASGAADKTVAQVYERAFRPEDKRHEPWLERCRTQVDGTLAELDRWCARAEASPWLLGARLSQADVTVACAFTFISDALALTMPSAAYPALSAAAASCEAMPEFQATRLALSPPRVSA